MKLVHSAQRIVSAHSTQHEGEVSLKTGVSTSVKCKLDVIP